LNSFITLNGICKEVYTYTTPADELQHIFTRYNAVFFKFCTSLLFCQCWSSGLHDSTFTIILYVFLAYIINSLSTF